MISFKTALLLYLLGIFFIFAWIFPTDHQNVSAVVLCWFFGTFTAFASMVIIMTQDREEES